MGCETTANVMSLALKTKLYELRGMETANITFPSFFFFFFMPEAFMPKHYWRVTCQLNYGVRFFDIQGKNAIKKFSYVIAL